MGKYVIAKTKNGFMFNIESANGTVLATSKVYSTKDGCKNAIESFKKIAKSPMEDQTVKGHPVEKKPKYEVFQDRKKEFGFRLITSNGSEIVSGNGYGTLDGCKKGVNAVSDNVNSEIIDKTGSEKKVAAKKPAAKKVAAKKPAAKATAKKAAEKKPAAKKPAAKPAAKKAPAKKPATKKAAEKKPVAKKAVAAKKPASKAVAKPAAKKAPAKSAAKKPAAKK